jgi:hypothetical protein
MKQVIGLLLLLGGLSAALGQEINPYPDTTPARDTRNRRGLGGTATVPLQLLSAAQWQNAALPSFQGPGRTNSPPGFANGNNPLGYRGPSQLWVEITNVDRTNAWAELLLHNTSANTVYGLLTRTNLVNDVWHFERLVMGQDTNTPAVVTTMGRTNALYVQAEELDSGAPPSVTDGQVWIQIARTSGTTGTVFAPLASGSAGLTWHWWDGTVSTGLTPAKVIPAGPALPSLPTLNVLLEVDNDAGLQQLNFGYTNCYCPQAYDYNDNGPTSLSNVPPLNVSTVFGSWPGYTGLTNFDAFLSPLPVLDFSHSTGIQDIECLTCTNLRSVNVTHCPNLERACFERCAVAGTLDFTGDTNLADIRGAGNQYTNIVFGGAGPKIWHLCIRDNPQLLVDVPLTNFYSLFELLIWNANQHGELRVGSTNSLGRVYAYTNRYESANFTNQAGQLTYACLQHNALTNLNVHGCNQLAILEGEANQMDAAALDDVLATLDSGGLANGYVDLSGNAQLPSSVGYHHVTNLLAKGWTVNVDYPEVNPGGYGAAGGTNALIFVTLATNVHLQVQAATGTFLIWHWADGTTDSGTNLFEVYHYFPGGDQGLWHTNYLKVFNRAGLTTFGLDDASAENGSSQIRAVYNLAAYPNLRNLWLHNEAIRDLSLAGCCALREVHLGNNPVSSVVGSQWFLDLDHQCFPNGAIGNFYYPVSVSFSSAAQAAATDLQAKGMAVHPF